MPVVDVIDGSDHRGVVPMAQVIDIQRMADMPDAVFHIQARRAVRIGLLSDRQLNLVRDIFDIAGRFMVDRRFYCPASGVCPITTTRLDPRCSTAYSMLPS